VLARIQALVEAGAEAEGAENAMLLEALLGFSVMSVFLDPRALGSAGAPLRRLDAREDLVEAILFRAEAGDALRSRNSTRPVVRGMRPRGSADQFPASSAALRGSDVCGRIGGPRKQSPCGALSRPRKRVRPPPRCVPST